MRAAVIIVGLASAIFLPVLVAAAPPEQDAVPKVIAKSALPQSLWGGMGLFQSDGSSHMEEEEEMSHPSAQASTALAAGEDTSMKHGEPNCQSCVHSQVGSWL